jgi:hypothetical protein
MFLTPHRQWQPAGFPPHPCCSRRSIMTNRATLTRSERLTLAGAAIRGVLAGATRAAITWLLVISAQ